jgi:hypothetical protein
MVGEARGGLLVRLCSFPPLLLQLLVPLMSFRGVERAA